MWRVTGRALVLGEIVRRRYIQLNVTGGRLRPDDGISIVYGDDDRGAMVQRWVTDVPATFEVEVSKQGNGAYTPVAIAPITVEPASAAHLHVVAPSAGRPGVAVPIQVRVLDAFGNLCKSWSADVCLVDGRVIHIREGRAATSVAFDREGVYRIEVKAPESGLSGRSNPCRVSTDTGGPYWGDPHVHTRLSDGAATPEFALLYGSDVACLDFTAITDHDIEFHHAWFTRRCQRLSDEEWGALGETLRRHRLPGKFAVIRAYEWTGRPYGDRCVYLRSDDARIRRYEQDDAPTTEELWRTLKQAEVGSTLVVPHTSASNFMGTDWAEHDRDLERLVEVYSMHGASECSGGPAEMAGAIRGRHIHDALARGYRLGFVAGGDMHSSQPGNPLLAIGPYRTLCHKPGLTAVFANRLHEEAVFDALRDRRTYATKGARMLLWFSVNGVPLGGELALGAGRPVVVHGRVHGTSELAEIAVVHNGERVYVAHPLQEDFEFTWEEPSPHADQEWTYYYLRAIQADDEVAWSSPVWVRVVRHTERSKHRDQ
jgi:hypothetical protein